MYDACSETPQSETTPFSSTSYYGIAKITENMLVKKHRENDLFAVTAILYNHESHRRGENFVTKKIASCMKKLKDGSLDHFELGNLNTKKDWGFAGDYAYGMYLMLKNEVPKDYVIATNNTHSIREFVSECAKLLQLDDWEKYISINEDLITRDNRVMLQGDDSLIKRDLGWGHTLSFSELVEEILSF